MKKTRMLFFILASVAAVTAVAGISNVVSAVSDICSGMTSLLPVAAMLLTVLGAVIYASGQVMGAETRARANVWATAAVTGAMMAVMITIVTPSIMESIYGESISCDGSGGTGCPPCAMTCNVGLYCNCGACVHTNGNEGDPCDNSNDCVGSLVCEYGLCVTSST